MRVSLRAREAGRRFAARAGVEDQLRVVYEQMVPAARRDRVDNEHLRVLFAATLGPDANCIDIGAHGGVLLREMTRCAPHGRHIAYEPLPEFAARLAREFPAVDVRNAAVADEAGEATFTVVDDDPMQSGLRPRNGAPSAVSREIRVRIDRLDDALADDYVPTLIKIDVEGAEHLVLRGARETLRRHRPIVCFEHGPGHEAAYASGPEQIFDLLTEEVGMRIYDIDGDGPYTRARFIAVFPEPIWNFIARP